MSFSIHFRFFWQTNKPRTGLIPVVCLSVFTWALSGCNQLEQLGFQPEEQPILFSGIDKVTVTQDGYNLADVASSAFANWDFTDIWYLPATGTSSPTLQFERRPLIYGHTQVSCSGGVRTNRYYITLPRFDRGQLSFPDPMTFTFGENDPGVVTFNNCTGQTLKKYGDHCYIDVEYNNPVANSTTDLTIPVTHTYWQDIVLDTDYGNHCP